MEDKTVYIVHAIDTEGPLAEQELTLEIGRNGDRDWLEHPDFNSSDFDPQAYIGVHRAGVLGSWEEIISMLRVATAVEQRKKCWTVGEVDGSTTGFAWTT